ncbi:UNKNOWN [Stylonychia lemnae]|uniref:Uncharacterized protein n=1 Tax=Stylonychia lemnae TaxID=5949 RepID=A0A078ATJ3_STYLE|nr:UNKNOWN [Stylonychia lemnae]|eukprot:CDW84512.1 UNKNOWN [Stylonychia lemnae]
MEDYTDICSPQMLYSFDMSPPKTYKKQNQSKTSYNLGSPYDQTDLIPDVLISNTQQLEGSSFTMQSLLDRDFRNVRIKSNHTSLAKRERSPAILQTKQNQGYKSIRDSQKLNRQDFALFQRLSSHVNASSSQIINSGYGVDGNPIINDVLKTTCLSVIKNLNKITEKTKASLHRNSKSQWLDQKNTKHLLGIKDLRKDKSLKDNFKIHPIFSLRSSKKDNNSIYRIGKQSQPVIQQFKNNQNDPLQPTRIYTGKGQHENFIIKLKSRKDALSSERNKLDSLINQVKTQNINNYMSQGNKRDQSNSSINMGYKENDVIHHEKDMIIGSFSPDNIQSKEMQEQFRLRLKKRLEFNKSNEFTRVLGNDYLTKKLEIKANKIDPYHLMLNESINYHDNFKSQANNLKQSLNNSNVDMLFKESVLAHSPLKRYKKSIAIEMPKVVNITNNNVHNISSQNNISIV